MYLLKTQQSLPSNNTNQAFGNHIEQSIPQTNNGNGNRILTNGQNNTSRPQLPQNEIQSQVQKLKKPSQTIQRQTSLPTTTQKQHEFTRVAATPGNTYSDSSNQATPYEGSLKSRRASDSNFQKESRQAIVGEIERLVSF